MSSSGVFGRGNVHEDSLEDLFDADAGFGRAEDGIRCVEADDFFDLLFYTFDIRGGKIDLIDDGHDFKAAIDGQMDIGQLCAWTPWTASMTSSAPSQAERERETS